MKHSAVCLFLIIAVLGLSYAAAQQCQEGQRTQQDCNTCTCRNGVFTCTRRFCARNKRQAPGCKDGATRQEDCNTCTCQNNEFTCTQNLCRRAKRQTQECQEGETKKLDCNKCTCNNGQFSCTQKLCASAHHPVDKRETKECVDGETKQQDCNTCTCRNGRFACTRKGCIHTDFVKRPAVEEHREKREVPIAAELKNTPCAPNDYFKIDCNTCYCNIDKTGYLCTENLCNRHLQDISTTVTNNDTLLITTNNSTTENNFSLTDSVTETNNNTEVY